VINIDELCNDVMVLDSDILWLKDFDVRDPMPEPRIIPDRDPADRFGTKAIGQLGCPGPARYKYCLSSMTSGAWFDDISK